MGIFSRRNAAPEETGRDIPLLNPMWFENQLSQAGKPTTSRNKAAIAGLTSANLALNATRWLDVVGTPEIRRRWDAEFGRPDEDLPSMLGRPDRMIDFLWAVSPRLHPGLRDFVGSMAGTFQDTARRFGPELPLDMWSAAG